METHSSRIIAAMLPDVSDKLYRSPTEAPRENWRKYNNVKPSAIFELLAFMVVKEVCQSDTHRDGDKPSDVHASKNDTSLCCVAVC